jgi:hypothetical protein
MAPYSLSPAQEIGELILQYPWKISPGNIPTEKSVPFFRRTKYAGQKHKSLEKQPWKILTLFFVAGQTGALGS